MKIFISADIEGVAGISNWNETTSLDSSSKYFFNQMTKEVNAACIGVNYLPATEIIIKDAHGSGRNINPDMLTENTKVFRDWSMGPMSMMEGLDSSFNAVIFIGYHSGANIEGNPLAHTFSGSYYQYIKLNGKFVSEFDLNSLIASYYNVPVVFLSGDKALCEKAKSDYPNITTVGVSEGFGDGSISIHPSLAIKLIEAGVKKALSKDLSLCKVEMPKKFEFEISFKEAKSAFRASFYTGVEKINAKVVKYVTDDYYEFLRMLMFIKS